MAADDLGNEGQAKAGPVGLGRDEGVEEMRQKVGGNSRPVIMHAKLQRQRNLLARTGNRQAHARTIGRGQLDFAIRRIAHRFRCILHQIEENLDHLVAIGVDGRQRWVVILGDLDVAGKAGLRHRLHMVEDRMDVDRRAIHRTFVGEDFHPVHQRDDPVGFVTDEAGQSPVVIRHGAFEKLGRAADTGQRILDLVRQHRGQTGHGTGGGAVRQLPVDLVGHGAFLEDDDDRTGFGHDRGDVEIHQLVLPQTRRRQINPVFVDRRTTLTHLIDERKQRRTEGNEGGNAVTGKMRRAGPEKRFSLPVRKGDVTGRINENDRVLNRVQNGHGERLARMGGIFGHAASFIDSPFTPAERAAVIRARTSAGSLDVITAARVSPVTRALARSRYQPRCLRAWRRPGPSP